MEVVVFTARGCARCALAVRSASRALRRAEHPFSLLTRDIGSRAAAKYGITEAPSVLILEDGRELGRVSGEITPEDLLAMLP